MPDLCLENVSAGYFGSGDSIRGISFTLKEGSFLTLLGGEKSGKTTLINAIAGLCAVSGNITLGDKALGSMPAEKPISVLFNDLALFPRRSVYYNLSYPLKLRIKDKGEILLRTEQAAERCGLYRLLDEQVFRLSEKDRIKLSLARLTLRESAVYLIDNPFYTLPARERKKAFFEFCEFKAALPGSVIYATDSVEEASMLGEEIYMLEGGAEAGRGKVYELTERPASAAAFAAFNPFSSQLSARLIKDASGRLAIDAGAAAFYPDITEKELISKDYIGKIVRVGFFAETRKITKNGEGLLRVLGIINSELGRIAVLDYAGEKVFALSKDTVPGEFVDISIQPRGARIFDLTSGYSLLNY